MLAVESGARHRRVDAQQRIERRHRPVRAEGERRSGIEHRPPGVAGASALLADAFFGPPPVIDGMVGLHRGNHAKLREARKVLRAHVLGVLDAKAMVTSVIAAGPREDVEYFGGGAVADGMNGWLNAGLVAPGHRLLHA